AVFMAAVFCMLGNRLAPAGSLTFLLTGNGGALGLLYTRGSPVGPGGAPAVAGIVADLLRALLRPRADRPLAFRTFSFLVPAVITLAYFASLALTRGVWWSVHVWTGTIVLSGAAGWLLGYVALPPRPAPAPAGGGRGRLSP